MVWRVLGACSAIFSSIKSKGDVGVGRGGGGVITVHSSLLRVCSDIRNRPTFHTNYTYICMCKVLLVQQKLG